MKLQKCITNLIANNSNLAARPVRFKFQGIVLKRRGIDIYNVNTGYIVATFEPENKGWQVKHIFEHLHYCARITPALLNQINPNKETGYKVA